MGTLHPTLTDSRVQMLTEVLHGIRVVKYFSWEFPYMQKACYWMHTAECRHRSSVLPHLVPKDPHWRLPRCHMLIADALLQILDLRKTEVRYVFWELMHWAGYISILIVFPIFAMTVTFATYAEGAQKLYMNIVC